MKTAALFAIVLAIGAAVGIGLKQATSEDGTGTSVTASQPSASEVQRKLAGAPPELAALHAQADELLPGGRKALNARLRELRGHPVVVNVWASWCGPCRTEMPILQQVALDRGREVGFLGVDLKDERAAAKRFLEKVPLSYPSYEDPEGDIYNAYRLAGVPSTIFYDAAGRQTYVHQGPYLDREALERDIDRYAGGPQT
jgi:thiol-disulfide isomerase/thioredoxin